MSDRNHEIGISNQETLELHNIFKEGQTAAEKGIGRWECPYYARSEEETRKVRSWNRGYSFYEDNQKKV